MLFTTTYQVLLFGYVMKYNLYSANYHKYVRSCLDKSQLKIFKT